MEKAFAIQVLEDAARMGQQAGIFSLEDSAKILEALNTLKAEKPLEKQPEKSKPVK